MTIAACWKSLKWERVIGEAISLRGLKSIIPGMWVNDEMINVLIKRYQDEAESD